jgi:hypothetical protein
MLSVVYSGVTSVECHIRHINAECRAAIILSHYAIMPSVFLLIVAAPLKQPFSNSSILNRKEVIYLHFYCFLQSQNLKKNFSLQIHIF